MSRVHEFTAFFPFCGLGAGARGFLQAMARLGADVARFRNLGGIDLDPESCVDFESLTGAPALRAAILKLTPQELLAFAGTRRPDAIFLSPPCLPGKEGVLTPSGERPIQEVRAGDLVLTHRGRFRKVLRVGSRIYTGTFYGLRLNGTEDVREFTATHPVWRRRIVKRRSPLGGSALLPSEFVPAARLRVGDRIGFPIDREERGCAQRFIDAFGDPRIVLRGGKNLGQRYAKPLHEARDVRVVDLRPYGTHPTLWFLIGAYLGDGYRRRDRFEVNFCVGPKNGQLTRRICAALGALGLSWTLDSNGGDSNVKVRVPSRHLHFILGAFGDGADRKDIPSALMRLEQPLAVALVDGYRSTDGSESARRQSCKGQVLQARWRIASVSLPLLRSLQRLLLRLSTYGSINRTWPGGVQHIMGRDVSTRPRWELTVRADPVKRTSFTFEDGAVWVRLRSIATRVAKDRVWNLEVEEDNTFCLHFIATHNCTSGSELLSEAA